MSRSEGGKAVRDYQNFVFNSFKNIFGENNVKKEWNVAKNSRDNFTRELYCPRLDIAVGPFNIDGNVYHNNERIRGAVIVKKNFLALLFQYSENRTNNLDKFLSNRNVNPRCFLAIEIENSGSSKHMLGNIANVSIIGSVGVVVPFNDEKLSLCKRIEKYVMFATKVGKIEAVFKNILIVSKENFSCVLAENSNIWICPPAGNIGVGY